MKNRELFQRDPAVARLMNNGQARITDGMTDKEFETLREELSNFVCEGQYASGMQRILDSYLGNLGNTSQPAAWVSGFFGSGKSHLLKMLCHLWVNTVFEKDGATARTLVPHLPSETEASLRELDTQGRRYGGLHSASGTLPAGGGGSVRLTVSGIISRSMGLPESYPQARFCLFLKNNGFLEKVRGQVEKAGKDFHRELNNLYVSPVLHDALMAVDPGYGDRKAVRELLKQDFPQREDITTQEFIQFTKEVLSNGGHLPCTVIVLDEVQLFIGESSDRATQVIEIAEALSKQMDSRVLLVGAGQTALTGTAQLQKLRDRITIPVELSDTDVESVTRKVLLAKRPEKIEAIRKSLEEHAGEISRQLANTSIAPCDDDRRFMVDDYPLLPARRRFWEHAFRAVDTAGTSGQLRTQLRIVYEALRSIAEHPLGTVVPADFMFEQLQPGLLQQGVLLRELDERIRGLDDGSEQGRLSKRLCGLIFLIRKLPREAGVDIGVRATAESLADLLVSDLTSDGAKLRKEVPKVLKKLAEDGVLLNVEGEFNLQTRESAEWDKEFRNRQTRLVNSDAEVHAKRTALIRDAASEALRSIKLQQGVAKEPRRLAISFGDDPPETSGREIPLWIRDGWTCSEKDVVGAARAAGTESPIIFAFVPKASADDLKKRIVECEAARGTLDFKGTPSNDEGREARDAMKTRLEVSSAARDEIIAEIVGGAKVFKGGGTELYNLSFGDKVLDAARDALDRLFHRFKEADHKNWPVVINRAKNGDDSPLQAVDWTDRVELHPVCREVLREAGSGKEGRAIRKVLGESPYGWPQDAIDGALIALHAAGHLIAKHRGTVLTAGQLDQNRIAVSDFRVESATISAQDRIKLRGLFQELGVSARPSDDLSAKAQEFLSKLLSSAEAAGGDPPLPERPNTLYLDEIRGAAGNEQLVKMLACHDKLKTDAARWKALAELAATRVSTWARLKSLVAHASGLPEAVDLATQMAGVRDDRLLLDSTDRVTPLAKRAAEVVRAAVKAARDSYQAVYDKGLTSLEASDVWKAIALEERARILGEESISAPSPLTIGTDEELIANLNATPLPSWREKSDALSQRFANAALKAAQLLEPKVQRIKLASGTLKSPEQVRAWLAEQEGSLVEKVKNGPIVIS